MTGKGMIATHIPEEMREELIEKRHCFLIFEKERYPDGAYKPCLVIEGKKGYTALDIPLPTDKLAAWDAAAAYNHGCYLSEEAIEEMANYALGAEHE